MDIISMFYLGHSAATKVFKLTQDICVECIRAVKSVICLHILCVFPAPTYITAYNVHLLLAAMVSEHGICRSGHFEGGKSQ